MSCELYLLYLKPQAPALLTRHPGAHRREALASNLKPALPAP